MTLDDLFNSVRARLQDISDESYSDAELLQYFNDAQKDFCIVGCNRAKTTVSLNGESSVTFTSLIYGAGAQDLVRVMRVDYGNEPLHQAPIYEEVRWPNRDATTPTGWAEWGEDIYLDAVFTGDLNFWIQYLPSDFTSASSPVTVPVQWTPALVAYVEYRCLDSSQDGQAAIALSEYSALKQQASELYGTKRHGPKRD
jgi:hypothetical protein